MTTLHLHPAERAMYDKLPAGVKEGWTVEEETQTTYENERQLAMRFHMASFRKLASVKSLVAKMEAGTPLTQLSLAEIPEDILPEFTFTIGARGCAALLMALLTIAKDDEDVRAIAALSNFRHDLLGLNA